MRATSHNHVPTASARSLHRLARGAGLVVAFLVLFQFASGAQPPLKPVDAVAKPAAMKLPDGTIILLTKSPDDVNPPIDGVLLSAQEYQLLVEQVEQFKKSKDNPKPQSPSSCNIRGKMITRGERTVANLQLTYTVQTSTPRCVVLLGCQRAFPLSAKFANGKLPILGSTDDGLTVLIEQPGQHTITVEVETPLTPRSAKGDLGFEIGLPRAAITTLAFDGPTGIKQLNIGLRSSTDRPGETRWGVEEVASLVRKKDERGYPLGPIDWLEVTWDLQSRTPATTNSDLKAEAEVAVRVEESQIITTTTFRLQGSATEWQLAMPATADVTTQRVSPLAPRESLVEPPLTPLLFPRITRPTDPAKPIWTFRPPETITTEWLVTTTVRQSRPKPTDPQHRGPYPIGPFHVVNAARQSGVVRIYAPPTIRISTDKPSVDLRRLDPPKAEDDLAGFWRYTTTNTAGPKPSLAALFELSTKTLPGFTGAQPTYILKRNDSGWRMQANVKVTPVRDVVNELVVEVPLGWQAFEASGLANAELIDEVLTVKETASSRQLAIRFATPQKTSFELVLTASLTGSTTQRREELLLLRFPTAQEQSARITATVPDGFEIAGSAVMSDGSNLALTPDRKAPTGLNPNSIQSVSVQSAKSLSRVDLTWQRYRPDLQAEIRADVDLQDNQAVVTQTIKFRTTEGDTRPITFTGLAVGLRLTSNNAVQLEQLDRDRWQIRHSNELSKDFAMSFKYSIPLPGRKPNFGPAHITLGLLWPETATKTETTIRIWGAGSSRRIVQFDGPWRELPSEANPERDTWPWLTLFGTDGKLPLSLELAESDAVLPSTMIDRTLTQAWLSGDGTTVVRSRFLLSRWAPTGVELELPVNVTPEISIDGRKYDTATLAPSFRAELTESRVVRIPLPEAKPGRTVLMLDVRYSLSSTSSQRRGVQIVPPRLLSAVFRSPARWQFHLPGDRVPLSFNRDLVVDQRWAWHQVAFSPTASANSADLEQWLNEGVEIEPAPAEILALISTSHDTLTGRQANLTDVQLVLLPRMGWIASCSVLTVVVGLIVSRLRPVVIGFVLTVLGVMLGIAVGIYPQPIGHLIAAMQPGLCALALLLLLIGLVRGYYQRRVKHLPGFTRNPGESVLEGTVSHVPLSGLDTRKSSPPSNQVILDGPGSRPLHSTTGS